ncbi:MAG: cell envelope integrity protein CreD [Alphaproteobacteria bacterium]|nr:cell envelope integrity protein CreD [Alphaproteobacteria bacterium]
MAILPDSVARSPGLKFLMVGLITLAMAVPLFFVFIALADRQDYARTAAADIARGWGGPQMIGGPALAVPYVVSETQRSADGVVTTVDVRRVAVFLPKVFKADAATTAETRARGIFKVNVFTADVVLSGAFGAPSFTEMGVTPKSIAWDQAVLVLAISDLQGLVENVSVLWGEAKTAVAFRPGMIADLAVYSGINARVPMTAAGGETPFSIALKLRGTSDLQFAAAGEETEVAARGNWPHPSFQGNFLPVTRKIESTGFTAAWKVPHLARNLPQAMPTPENLMNGLNAASFGVSFYQPVNFYLLVERALKYAILFIGLAFLSFFLIETLSGARIHGVQYLLIGGAQVVFYLLLLSLSEQIGFEAAYLAAAVATVALISAYAWSAMKSSSRAMVVFGVLSVLYALLFVLLKQEDYALVIGSAAAFAAIAVTMYVTRNVDWYRTAESKNAVGFGR